MEYLHKDFPPIDAEKFEKIQKESPKHKKEDILLPKNKMVRHTRHEGDKTDDIDENRLKQDIYDVMMKHFNGFGDINHAVARDFSLRELETFINEYYNYLLK